MLKKMRRARFLRGFWLAGLGVSLVSACSASNGNKTAARDYTSGGATGSGATGSGATGSGATGAGTGASTSTGAGTGIGDINTNGTGATSSDAGCQHIEVNFVPKIPSIFVLVDRSGSMFDSMAWEPLKAGVLAVIQQLQGQIKFGFSAFTGEQGQTCPIFDPVAPALNNFAAISSAYTMLTRPAKGETPLGLALPLVQQALMAPGNDGDKYILFVTDGEPDFCDDGDQKCPVDSSVSHLQTLKAQGITTIVFGLKSALSSFSPQTLQAFANAGAGQPVALPFAAGTTAQGVCYECQGVNGWKADWTGSTRTPDCTNAATQTLATYAAADGNATVYQPDAADQAALTAQISSVITGIKSCTFDLSDVTVNLNLLSQASVAIQGATVPLDMTNGWRMNSTTQLELVGDACTTWNKPENTKIDFNFPCEILVVK